MDIAAGEHVHSHNLGIDDTDRDYEFGTARTVLPAPSGPPRTFAGYHRASGRVGTRNYVGVLTSVNCLASSATMIADQFRGKGLDAFPHVDGVLALTHQSGCGLVSGSVGAHTLVRMLRGYARHPNFGGLLVLGLGCEMVPAQSLVEGLDLPADTIVATLTIQDTGGVRATVRAGAGLIQEMLPVLDARRRAPAPISELVLGLNCGSSDGYSLFTLDETVFSRELAPLAGFYPSVYIGAPWWFLDAPDAVRRWRCAVTDTSGFSRTSGFIDDTRAFCSIPARHDMSRRLDSGHLAQLVAEHRLDADEDEETAVDLVTGRPQEVFNL